MSGSGPPSLRSMLSTRPAASTGFPTWGSTGSGSPVEGTDSRVPPDTQRPAAGSALVVWFVLRLLALLGAAAELIIGVATRSIAAMTVVAAFTVVCALLDAWVLRLRHVEEPLEGGLRARTVIDTWQPVAAF